MPAKFLRKITPKTITEQIGIDLLSLPRPVKPMHLYDLFGQITGAIVKPDRTGQGKPDSVQFSGILQAVVDSGEVFDSGRTFIPVMEPIVYTAFMTAREADPKAILEVALSIHIMPAAPGKPSATGYEFDVQRLIQVAPSPQDPIARLRKLADEQRKTLTHEGATSTTMPEPMQAPNQVPKSSPARGPHKAA